MCQWGNTCCIGMRTIWMPGTYRNASGGPTAIPSLGGADRVPRTNWLAGLTELLSSEFKGDPASMLFWRTTEEDTRHGPLASHSCMHTYVCTCTIACTHPWTHLTVGDSWVWIKWTLLALRWAWTGEEQMWIVIVQILRVPLAKSPCVKGLVTNWQVFREVIGFWD